MAIEESQHLWVDDPVFPAQLLEADLDGFPAAVVVLLSLLGRPLQQGDSRGRPGDDQWRVTDGAGRTTKLSVEVKKRHLVRLIGVALTGRAANLD